MPQLAVLSWYLVFDGIPGELEPFVGPLEQHSPGEPEIPDEPQEGGVDLHRLELGVISLITAERTGVGHCQWTRGHRTP